jgi:hypothetical protein
VREAPARHLPAPSATTPGLRVAFCARSVPADPWHRVVPPLLRARGIEVDEVGDDPGALADVDAVVLCESATWFPRICRRRPHLSAREHSSLGQHVFVNRGVLVGHYTEIGGYVTLHPGANVAGACRVGEGTYVSMGAVVLDHLAIGEGAVVGAGAVVTSDVPPHVQVVGVPARIVKEGVDGR